MNFFLKSVSRGIHILLGTCDYLFKRTGIEKLKMGKQGKKCFHLKVQSLSISSLALSNNRTSAEEFMQPSGEPLTLGMRWNCSSQSVRAEYWLPEAQSGLKGISHHSYAQVLNQQWYKQGLFSLYTKRKPVEKVAALPSN